MFFLDIEINCWIFKLLNCWIAGLLDCCIAKLLYCWGLVFGFWDWRLWGAFRKGLRPLLLSCAPSELWFGCLILDYWTLSRRASPIAVVLRSFRALIRVPDFGLLDSFATGFAHCCCLALLQSFDSGAWFWTIGLWDFWTLRLLDSETFWTETFGLLNPYDSCCCTGACAATLLFA